MSGFQTNLILRVGDEAFDWLLEVPLAYKAESGEVIVVPAGFSTDLASIPRIFHGLIPVNGKHRAAAVLHDYLFVVQDRSRSRVDALFLEAMESLGVRWIQRWAMYAAVRVGGWLPWRRNKLASANDRPSFLARHGLQGA